MEKAKEKLGTITKYFTEFSDKQIEQLAALEGVYSEWNSKINVISRKDEEQLYEKHVLHSLSIAAAFDFRRGMNVLDLGTGGGFPGIPLAIFFPEVNFHLVDSIGKKIKVVEAVAAALELKNVSFQHSRVEDIRNRKFEVVVSRAVAPLGELWKWSKPLLKSKKYPVEEGDLPVPNGLICLKGGDLAAEIAESHTRPRMMEIAGLFDLPSFEEKFILYVPL